MPVVELPDGTEAEFPDTMPASDIAAVLRKHLAPQLAIAPKPETIGKAESTMRGAVEGVPFGQKAVSAGTSFGVKLLQFLHSHGMYGNDPVQPGEAMPDAPPASDAINDMDSSYAGAYDKERSRFKEAKEQHPWMTGLGQGAGFALSMAAPLPKFKSAPGVGLGERVATTALNAGRYGALHGAGGGALDEPLGEKLQRMKREAELNGVLGAGGQLVGEGLGVGARWIAPKLGSLANAWKVSSARPNPAVVEEMAALPGGKEGVGEAMFKHGVGGLTADSVAESAGGALNRVGPKIDQYAALADAERAANASRVSGTADEMLSDLGRSSRDAATKGGAGRPLRAAPPPLPAGAGTEAAGPLEGILGDAHREIAGPMMESADEGIRANGERLARTLASLTQKYAGKAGAQDGLRLTREIQEIAYRTKDPALLSYADALQRAAGSVREGTSDLVKSIAPDAAQGFEGAKLDYRRLLLAKQALDRTAGRETRNHALGLYDLAAGAQGGPMAMAFAKSMRAYGAQAGARGARLGSQLLGILGSNGAVEPEAQTLGALLRARLGSSAARLGATGLPAAAEDRQE